MPVKKGDFLPLFHTAWKIAFKKQTILRSFEVTGVWPIEGEVILKRFRTKTPEPEEQARMLEVDLVRD